MQDLTMTDEIARPDNGSCSCSYTPASDAAINFNTFEYARQRHTISDGDVAFEKGGGDGVAKF